MREAKNDDPHKTPRYKGAFSIKRHVWFGAAIMSLLAMVVGGWSATAQLTGAIIASGTVVVERHVKKVQHNTGGIVATINVKNGDLVKQGQILIGLDETQLRAEIGIVDSQMAELTARVARLTAERDGRSRISFPNEIYQMSANAKKIMSGETRLFEANRTNQSRQKAQLELQVEQLKQEIAGIKAQREGKRGQLDIIARELKQVRRLYKKKLTAVGRVYSMEREAKRLSGEHGGLVAQIARARGKISEVELQILSIDQQRRAESQKELRAIEARMAELKERHAVVKDRLARCKLRAPLSGVVHELAVHTIGGVIVAAEPVMLIVPKGETLAVDVKFSPVDIDQIVPGRKARLRFSAFDQKTTPEINGEVVRVSADVSIDAATGQQYYLGRVELGEKARDELSSVKLVPGMPAEVFIETRTRTALSYFLKPLADPFARALRES